MSKLTPFITFPLADLTISVPASEAYLLLDQMSTVDAPTETGDPESKCVLYRGKLIPCLDLGRCFGLEPTGVSEGHFSLIIESGGELASLCLPSLRMELEGKDSKVCEVSDRFQGLPHLLLSEERHSAAGVWYQLDVEMAVRIAMHGVYPTLQSVN